MWAAAVRPRTAIAGHAWSERRAVNVTAAEECSATCAKRRRSSGTPAASARADEQINRAAAWSTVHWLACHLLYGKARGRLAGPGVAMASALRGAGNAASGFV